jgi:hypothetical protein
MSKTRSLQPNGVAGDLPDLVDLRLPDHMIPAVKVDLPCHREIKARKARQYVPALPIRLTEKVARVKLAYRWVFVAVWFLCKSRKLEAVKHGGWVRFTNGVARQFGIERHVKVRAVRALSRAKLVRTKFRKGKTLMVKLNT